MFTSQEAYGACVYLRSFNNNDEVTVHLLCAKTRVSPLKPLTIPRLELCGALLGARLVAKVCDALRCEIQRKVFWSDSSIVLAWIKKQPKDLNAFVCNRLIEIHELTSRESWRHVPTSLNPADLASRGLDPDQLQKSDLWFYGPVFLKNNDESQWPQQQQNTLDLPEVKVHTNITYTPLLDFKRYSKFNKLKYIMAYIKRFIFNCQNSKNRKTGKLSLEEINSAEMSLVKIAQHESFFDELNILKNNKTLPTKSSLLQLSPFIDNNAVLRVGGRLQNTEYSYNKQHPTLLHGKHYLTKLIMENEHLRLMHAGPQLLLSSVRDQYWPIGGRALARKILRECVVCTRMRGKTMEQLMGNLPADRLHPGYPFQVCGTDLAGPFLISSKKGRGNKISKCYLCLFICFATKAIHLEIVSDMSSDAFILCLRRFIARRGKPYKIYCDNGRNFVGANNELGRLFKLTSSVLDNVSAKEGIEFSFIPPYSPTMGGLWEAGIRAAKYHLKRICNSSLTFEELNTLFTQIS